MFRAHVLIIRRSKLHYIREILDLELLWRKIKNFLNLGKKNLSLLSVRTGDELAYRQSDTKGWRIQGRVMQFWSLDDEHMCSKHVEAWNKTYYKTNFVHKFG